MSTSKAYRGQGIYWKVGKLHIVGLALDWTFHWWWLASILNTLVPQINIFRALTFLVDESTSPSVYRPPYSTSTHREAVGWVHYRRVNTCICQRKCISHCISTQVMAVLTVNCLSGYVMEPGLCLSLHADYKGCLHTEVTVIYSQCGSWSEWLRLLEIIRF